MLGRRILRIKSFKAVYTYSENPSLTVKDVQAQMDKSCEAARDLYLFMLILPQALVQEAENRIKAAQGKFNPSPEEKNPNMKFVRNSLVPILADDPDLNKAIQRKKFSWEQYDAFLRHLYDSVRSREYFVKYMENPSCSLREDAALFIKIYEEELVDSKELEDILSDMSIWWNDDLAYALTWDCRSLDAIAKGQRWELPELYQSEMKKDPDLDDDRAFVKSLLRMAVSRFDDFVSQIASCTPKWDRSRICATDLALIVCGLAEHAAFPDTPRRIIINEYVDISKYYSTPESRAFVNGILDKLLK
ncbi:MAG: transcription antitermination protein NusB [Bacteroidales bacterium]|nr:transcription antitermination protein NusB [Bacteroidales bacterium]